MRQPIGSATRRPSSGGLSSGEARAGAASAPLSRPQSGTARRASLVPSADRSRDSGSASSSGERLMPAPAPRRSFAAAGPSSHSPEGNPTPPAARRAASFAPEYAEHPPLRREELRPASPGGEALGATERFGVPPPRRSSVSSFADRGSSAEQLGSGGYETIAEESCRGSASGDGELTPAERMRRRKLADADRRSVELQRHARSSISENREIAKGIRSMQLRSNLDASCAPGNAACAAAGSTMRSGAGGAGGWDVAPSAAASLAGSPLPFRAGTPPVQPPPSHLPQPSPHYRPQEHRARGSGVEPVGAASPSTSRLHSPPQPSPMHSPTPSLPSSRPERPASHSRSASDGPPLGWRPPSQEGPRAKLGSEQAPSRGRTPAAPAGLQGWAQRGGGGDGGAGAGSCAGGVGAEDNDEEEEGAYEDDFDEYEATLKHDPAMLQRTQRAAAAARDSNARDAAERQRLLQQAAQAQLSQDRLALAASRRSSTAGLAERAAAHEYGRGASSEALSALAEYPRGPSAPPHRASSSSFSPTSLSHEEAPPRPPPAAAPPPRPAVPALQDKCREALGDLFPPVYAYLTEARGQDVPEREVRRQLTMLVGRERLNDCMWVDQLVFKEIMMR